MKKVIYALIGTVLVGGGVVWLTSDIPSFSDISSSLVRDDDRATTRSFDEYGDYDCSDFSSWRQAQDFFENEGGPTEDYHNLDRDGDGVACENLKKGNA